MVGTQFGLRRLECVFKCVGVEVFRCECWSARCQSKSVEVLEFEVLK